MTFFAFDLAELSDLEQQVSILSYNRRAILTLNDKDYLQGTSQESIEDQLNSILPESTRGDRHLLVTSPKYLGRAFNPVNFHLRLRESQLVAAVAEVNNTFGDRHIYPLSELKKAPKEQDTWIARCPKNFHVSPFNNMDGDYLFTFRITGKEIFLGVDLHRDGECVIRTWITGKYHPLTNRSIFQYALFHPFDTALNSFPRILWQAAILYYKKKLPIFKRPTPQSPATLIKREVALDHERPIV